MPRWKPLSVTHPELVTEWHPDNNLSPQEVSFGMRHKVLWKCKNCQHVWQSGIQNRTGKRKSGCLFCAGQCVHSDGHNSLLVTHPELAKEMIPELNDGVGPDQIMSGSNKKRVWTCKTISETPCGHIWSTHPYVRTRGIGCPVCANLAIHIDGRNSMRKTHPDLANEMHPTKNGEMNPDNTITGTAKKIWWVCKIISDTPCNHVWQTTGNSRFSNNAGCPACANQSLHTDGINSMRNTHPKLSEEFHPTKNGDFSPDNIIATTAERLYWQCTTLSAMPCGHIWEARRVRKLVDGLEITPCPACSNIVLHQDGRNSLAQLFPELAKEFHPSKNHDKTPENILPGSRKRVHWICTTLSENPCGHEWSTWIYKRTTGSKTGCPACSKGGFDPSKPSQYYVIRIENEDGDTILYKGGISNEFSKRFSQHEERFARQQRSSNWKLVVEEISDFTNGQDARDLETKLLGIKEIRAPNVADVSSELFIVNPLDYAREMGYFHG